MFTATTRADVYSRVTDKIVEQLERGVRPWSKPWSSGNAGSAMRPLRFNGEPYRGINTLMLWGAAEDGGYASPTWLTFNQAKASGGCVRRGEHGSLVVYASKADGKPDEDGEVSSYFFMRGYTVFNVDQVDGLPDRFYTKPETTLDPAQRIERAEQFFAATGADIRHGGDRACYYGLGLDYIQMPPFVTFRDPESYYGTLAHEHVHWTGHATRLSRDLANAKGTHGYAREEMVAEIGAAFTCCDLGIASEPREDHAAYLSHWLTILKADKRAIFQAASHAQRAVDYLHDRQAKPETN